MDSAHGRDEHSTSMTAETCDRLQCIIPLSFNYSKGLKKGVKGGL